MRVWRFRTCDRSPPCVPALGEGVTRGSAARRGAGPRSRGSEAYSPAHWPSFEPPTVLPPPVGGRLSFWQSRLRCTGFPETTAAGEPDTELLRSITLPPTLLPAVHCPVAPISDCEWLPWICRLPSISLPQILLAGPAAWFRSWTLPWTMLGSPPASWPI